MDDDTNATPAIQRGTQSLVSRSLLHGHDYHGMLFLDVRSMNNSDEIKPLSEETDIQALRDAIDEYRELAKELFLRLGCGCGEDLCWNCTKARQVYKTVIKNYK